MTAMIISFADEPRVVQEFTDNTRLLRERLTTIEPTAASTDLLGALKLAEGLANPAQVTVQEGAPEVDVVEPESATLFILSDGRFSDVEGFALGNLDPVYVPLGSAETDNLAVTALQTRKSEAAPGVRQAFVQVANFSTEAVEAVVELRLNGRLLDAQRLEIAGEASRGVTFPLGEASAGALEARLTETTLESVGDRLALDNRAFAAVNDIRDGRVLFITPGNIAIEQAIATARADRLGGVEIESPAILKSAEHKRLAASGAFDLVIYDRCEPEEMPRANTLFVGRTPPLATWVSEESEKNDTVVAPQIIDWNRAHPLLAHIEMGNFDIVESLLLHRPQGGTTLIDAAEGPIAVVAPRDGFEDVVLGFAILVMEDGRLQRNTDWINRHSFPTFWLNTLEYFVGQATGGSQSVRPGAAVELKPIAAASKELVVVAPDGKRATLHRRGSEPFVFQATGETGVYQVFEAGQATDRFAVNLFDHAESDIRLRIGDSEETEQAAVAGIRIGNIDVAAAAGAAAARQELWRPILVLALLVLLLEWYIYHRRVYV